ncbi:MAG: phage tail sheath family protein [Deltaproteobacteria bacterium]|nr:phage tail sheath family protein [Deltaproteobacteria bacterium]MBZ0219726.1 phage tail sheath subtilisin-like domain-containing protein [Deltaproteobacteria bacterium]
MPTTYKMPGVYIEEIPKFPPSIAPVETAIPAFIGYTQKAEKVAPGDLINVPTKIGSIAEYEAYFGVGSAPSVTEVILDDSRNFKSASVGNMFYMYDSLRLFYANGGGDCYIVSTGSYDNPSSKTKNDFIGTGKGIDALEAVDEPTILVFPDNSLLDADFYEIYMKALDQCGRLMDRVCLFHVKEDDSKGANFRPGIGIKDLKYGMAYSPWLKASFPKDVTYRDFKDVIKIGETRIDLSGVTDDTKIKGLISEYEDVISDNQKIGAVSSLLAGTRTLREKFTDLESVYLSGKTVANFMKLIDFLFGIARKADELIGTSSSALKNEPLRGSLGGLIESLAQPFSELISYDKELVNIDGYEPQYNATMLSANEWDGLNATPPSAILEDTESDQANMDEVLGLLRPLFDKISKAWLGLVDAARKLEKDKHDGLISNFPLYKTIITGIQNKASIIPPSGAVAGVYAYVDRTRGVWKAPANVSISGIVGPKDMFTASELDSLNIDPNGGKSINAIRAFTGKGTLVWGARTLAGNDNEWRYVNVRRFFNFVEESTKKATEQFVFEPNDANTWVRVQAMIENFLTVLWRQGALQGVKPEHAFYVAVGLGKTMTTLDILEGRMIVEIGMAVVRPAEFIVLRFSHKMAES